MTTRTVSIIGQVWCACPWSWGIEDYVTVESSAGTLILCEVQQDTDTGKVERCPTPRSRLKEPDGFSRPRGIFIGTGPPPDVPERRFASVCWRGPESNEKECVAALVGYGCILHIFLYGDWETLISRKTFGDVWKSCLSTLPVRPKLFIDSVEVDAKEVLE